MKKHKVKSTNYGSQRFFLEKDKRNSKTNLWANRANDKAWRVRPTTLTTWASISWRPSETILIGLASSNVAAVATAAVAISRRRSEFRRAIVCVDEQSIDRYAFLIGCVAKFLLGTIVGSHSYEGLRWNFTHSYIHSSYEVAFACRFYLERVTCAVTSYGIWLDLTRNL